MGLDSDQFVTYCLVFSHHFLYLFAVLMLIKRLKPGNFGLKTVLDLFNVLDVLKLV